MTKRILVVDDDVMNREILEAFLTSENYQVSLAHNGASALHLAERLLPDLVILDVRMPDMTGYEVCKQLRLAEQTRHIPIMIVTGFDSAEDRQQGLDAGANDFLPRPFSGEQLIAHVRQLLNG